MTLVISKGITLRKGWQPMDPDAAAYITAVETADTEPLEEKTKIAIDNFVLGCKADGIWTAIKASCILAGARTLAGALVPLVGTAPTNFNFVDADYSRKTGLVGNGSTKYLNSNRNNNADPQNSNHNAIYLQDAGASFVAQTYLNSGSTTVAGANQLAKNTANTAVLRNRTATGAIGNVANPPLGLFGTSRSSSGSYAVIASKNLATISQSSEAASSGVVDIFRRSEPSVGAYSDARLAFYSIGESLDLALLDARVTDLINAIGAAIP